MKTLSRTVKEYESNLISIKLISLTGREDKVELPLAQLILDFVFGAVEAALAVGVTDTFVGASDRLNNFVCLIPEVPMLRTESRSTVVHLIIEEVILLHHMSLFGTLCLIFLGVKVLYLEVPQDRPTITLQVHPTKHEEPALSIQCVPSHLRDKVAPAGARHLSEQSQRFPSVFVDVVDANVIQGYVTRL